MAVSENDFTPRLLDQLPFRLGALLDLVAV